MGQDLLRDECDEEGSAGEVGIEILRILLKNFGHTHMDVIVEGMYGMTLERLSNEIFTLEKNRYVRKRAVYGFL